MNFRHTPGTVDVMCNVHDVKGCKAHQVQCPSLPSASEQGLRKRRKPGSKDWVRKDSSKPHGFVEVFYSPVTQTQLQTRVLTASHFCLNALLVLTGFPTSVYVEFGLSGLPQLLEGLSTVVKKRQAEARMHRSMNVKDVAVLVLKVYAACLFVQKGTIFSPINFT